MKKNILIYCSFLFLLLVASCGNKYKYEEVKGDLSATRIYTLDNGLKVYLSVNKEAPRIQTYVAVRTGSKNDPAETTGLAHYLEHLMFKGTKLFGTNNPEAEAPLLDEIEKRYEEYRLITDPALRKQKYHEIDSISQLAAKYFIPNEYDKLMATIGAEGTNAYTSNDVTCYTEDIPSNEIENWAKIQADRFQNMVIRGFHTELEAVYEEYNIGLSNDQRKLFTALCAKLWPNHPYGTQTTIGTQEHLKNPSIKNIKEYFKKWYVPNNVAICMAGDFDPDKTIAIISKYFGEWKPALDENGKPTPVKQPEFAALPPLTSPQDTTIIGQEAETLWLGWRFEKAVSLQNDTLDLIEQILNNGEVGLIDLDLNQGMKVQEAFAGSEMLAEQGAFLMGGTPRQGQSLDEVKQLLLDEMEKLKRGEFSDNLLPAIINNAKLNNLRALDSNKSRADRFVDAFINGIPWEQEVGKIDRMAKISKKDIVKFANRHFGNNYVAIYKRQGIDTTVKSIDKPSITPIPANRDMMSDFVKEIQNSKVDPIKPQFVDFKKDLTFAETDRSLPVVYKQNNDDDRFNLIFRYEFGTEADNRYEVAADYINYLGTDKLTAAQVKEKFYEIACSYSVNVNSDNINISLRGLNENMPKALQLLEDFLQNAKVDKAAYDQNVDMILKARTDAKMSQRQCFDALYNYAIYGQHNPTRNQMTAQQLRDTDPQTLLNLLRDIRNYEHSVLYYGPLSVKKLAKVISKTHKTPEKLMVPPQNKPYQEQATPTNEIIIAPYSAQNIYMRMYHNEQKPWDVSRQPVIALFNEYYGQGMNGIVFQELREARGLAYNAGAAYLRPTRTGQTERYFTHIITQNDKMMDCVREFHAILDNMPQSESAFNIAKDALTKQIASSRTTKMNIINAWLMAKRIGLETDLNETVYNALPDLKLADIVDFEKQNMAGKPYRYIILGNEKNLDMNALQQIAPVKRVTLQEIFGY